MNDFSNRREYNPFVRFCVSARPPRDGEIRQPIVQFNAMEPPAGSYIQGFNALQQPCSLEEDPMYIVHPESMTPPRGYARIDVPSGQPEATKLVGKCSLHFNVSVAATAGSAISLWYPG